MTMRRPEFFSLFDYTAIEAHLTKMAEKGWLLEKMGPFFWTYRPIPPTKLTFHVAYFLGASRFDPAPTPALTEYADFAAHTGWRRCASMEFLQIFYTAEENPAPMETDPTLRLNSLQAAFVRSALPLNVCVLLVCGLMLSMLGTLSGPTALFVAVGSVLCMVYYVLELTVYGLWFLRASRLARAGDFTPSPCHSGVLRVFQGLAFTLIAAFIAVSVVYGAGVQRLAGLAAVPVALALFQGTDSLRERLNRLSLSRGQNRAAVFTASAALFAVLSAAMKLFQI